MVRTTPEDAWGNVLMLYASKLSARLCSTMLRLTSTNNLQPTYRASDFRNFRILGSNGIYFGQSIIWLIQSFLAKQML